MLKKNKTHMKKLILILSALFLLCSGIGLYAAGAYIDQNLLQANENTAIDIAMLVKNNFSITDAEVAYMRGLTFNEMEVDPINSRLMDVGNGVKLNAEIINVYLVAAMEEDKIKYTTDEETAAFFDYEVGTPLDGIWLLNGIIDEDGHFVVTQREDVYRYTHLTADQREGMRTQAAFGEYSVDASVL